MIEKMAYVSITGPKKDFDRIIDEYLCRYKMQLENSYLRADSNNGLSPFSEENPYKAVLEKANTLCSRLSYGNGKKAAAVAPAPMLSRDDAIEFVNNFYTQLEKIDSDIAATKAKVEEAEKDLEAIAPFSGIEYNLEDIFSFKHIVYRFGRIPKDGFKYFEENVFSSKNSYFAKGQTDDKYVWGVYFAPIKDIDKTDAAYASLRFERMPISDKYTGTPQTITKTLTDVLAGLKAVLTSSEKKREDLLTTQKDMLLRARNRLDDLSGNFDAHSYSALLGTDSRFILCAWMSLNDALALEKEFKDNEPDVDIFIKDPMDSGMTPPTKIKNAGPVKPFEMYTKMYGLPAYGEFDPTWLVALTYSVMFGMMFGDLGQGLVLLIGGAILYFTKKMKLAGIVSCAGFCSSIFGILFGSFFGFEDILPALWLKPKEAMIELNFIGRINTVFVVAVAFGMIFTIILMLFNIYNGFKQKDFSTCLFGSNGIAGVIFYGFLVLVVFLYMSDKALPATIVLILFIAIPLLFIALNTPLTNMINKKKAIEGGVGMFCMEAFFDLFEICLSYFSNTLSFVRIGAFAVSHAAMMEVVLQLAGYENGGGNIIGIIIGNFIVIGFEGLIVGIQVLRLEYYEIFSKFYKGTGREFKPFFRRRAI